MIYLFLFLFPLALFGEIDPQPLLPLTQEIHVQMDKENLQALKADQQKEVSYNQKRLKSKSFPWNGVLQVIGLLLIFILAKSKNIVPASAHEVQRALSSQAREHALQEIERLSRVPPQKDSYVELSNVLRQFIQRRYQVHSMTITTPEFIKELKNHPVIDEGTRSIIEQFITKIDLVKFSNQEPTPQDYNFSLQFARDFVKR